VLPMRKNGIENQGEKNVQSGKLLKRDLEKQVCFNCKLYDPEVEDFGGCSEIGDYVLGTTESCEHYRSPHAKTNQRRITD